MSFICSLCGEDFYNKYSLKRHSIKSKCNNIMFTNLCNDIYKHIKNLMAIPNISEQAIIDSLKNTFTINSTQLVDVRTIMTFQKQNQLQKNQDIAEHFINTFQSNQFEPVHKQIVDRMNELSLKDNMSEEDFKKAINTEYEFIEFYKFYLESIREGHGLPTTEIYNIAETFISSSIRSHELKLSKKRSIDDTHAHMKFQQVSTASSSTETYPVASPSPVVLKKMILD